MLLTRLLNKSPDIRRAFFLVTSNRLTLRARAARSFFRELWVALFVRIQ
jgi:hypothetical protein